MTALFSTRRRAEEFAAALDGRNSVLTGDLRELVGVATVLRSHDTLEAARPRDDFAADLRSRLMAEAEHVLVPTDAPLVLPVRQRGPRERRLVAAASVVVLFGGTASMAAAAQQSLPGEALYPIKRGIERAEAGLSVSTAGKGQDLLEQANDRLTEVENLLAGDSMTAAPQVPQTLTDFTEQAQEGSGLLMASFEETRDPATIISVREFTANAITLLQDLARTAPAEAQDELAAAAMALGEIDREANALCGGCATDIPELEVPDIFLAAAEVDRAFAVIDGRFLDNSHPFIVAKRSEKQTEDALTPSTGDAGTGFTPPAPTGDDSSSPALGLPGSETDVSKGNKDAQKTVEKTLDGTVGQITVGQITDGLAGVVETVLPDPLQTSE
ncbi:MAG: DUF5667 domain-containing protein [Nocardioides sp.]